MTAHYPSKGRTAANEYFIGFHTVSMAWSKNKCSMTFIFIKRILCNHKRGPTIHLFTFLSAVTIANNCGCILRWFLCWEKFCSSSNNFLFYKGILWTHWMGICFISILLVDFSLSEEDWIFLMGWFRIFCRIMTFRPHYLRKNI